MVRSSVDAIGTGLNAHSAEADSMRIQFCTVWTGLYTLKNSVLSLARHLYISIILLREGYALLKCFSL